MLAGSGLVISAMAPWVSQNLMESMRSLMANADQFEIGFDAGSPGALELLFATHPMSEERYATAVGESRGAYASTMSRPRSS